MNIIRFDGKINKETGKCEDYIFQESDFSFDSLKQTISKKAPNVKPILANFKFKGGECHIKFPKTYSGCGFMRSTIGDTSVANFLYNYPSGESAEEIKFKEFWDKFQPLITRLIMELINKDKNSPIKLLVGNLDGITEDKIKSMFEHPSPATSNYAKDISKLKSCRIEGRDNGTMEVQDFKKRKLEFKSIITEDGNRQIGQGSYVIIVRIGYVYFGGHGNRSDKVSVKCQAIQVWFDKGNKLYDADDILGDDLQEMTLDESDKTSERSFSVTNDSFHEDKKNSFN